MHIRIYSPFFPFPSSEGAFVVIAGQVEGFLEMGHQVELVYWKGEAQLSAAPKSSSLKIINWSESSQRKDTFPNRLLRVVTSLFSAESSTGKFYYPKNLDRRDELGPCDLAIYHHCYAHGWLKRPRGSEKKKVIYFHNIESELFEQMAGSAKNFFVREVHRFNAQKVRIQEMDSLNLVEEIWQVSPVDHKTFNERIESSFRERVKFRAPCYSPSIFQRRRKNFLRSPTIDLPIVAFIGGLAFQPNSESLQWFLSEVAPLLLEKEFKGEVRIVGGGASQELIDSSSRFPFVKFLGFLVELEEFWKDVSLMIVPHVSGSGVRIKLLEGLASGIPVLANSQAVERIHPDLSASKFLIEKSQPQDWVNAIMGLKGCDLRRELSIFEMDRALQFNYIYWDFRR